jgi:protocatechuate 3,4-dioxygenase alpha subunit
VTLPRTPSQTVGPFYAIGLCRRTENELVDRDAPDAVPLVGLLLDGAELPVPDGLIEIWDPDARRWGRCGTDGDGRFSFVVSRRTRQLAAYVFCRGLLRHQLTRIYIEAEPEDAALASLVAARDGEALRFDIRLQGDRQTVFFAV